LLSELALLLLQLEDTLLDSLSDSELVDNYIDSLGQTVNTINGLFFDKLANMLAS
jgi:hypothetical protein